MIRFLESIPEGIRTLFVNLFQQPDWRNYLDIFITTVIIYELIVLMIRTRSSAVIKGVLVLLLFAWITDILQLNVVNWLIQQVLNTGVIMLVVLFQPELRRALEQLGRTPFISSPSSSHAGKHSASIVPELVQAMSDMSRKRIGALIVVERKTGLQEFVDTGTIVNADVSAALIENIFEPNTPLHDGALIIRDGKLHAAACILQLTNDPDLSRELGTRHRAAIGITETSDAVSFIVSEETGTISMARDGKITRYLDIPTLTRRLNELFDSGAPKHPELAAVFGNGGKGGEAQ
ncbi:MAG: diadenylate cyclase CdaA [Clostridia bacterium]|nr:diadenylate cyclase CdaA [Clostridia bacterium]MBQ9408611.1 diadenylate cyclase CdaA [Clostridia bacterium]